MSQQLPIFTTNATKRCSEPFLVICEEAKKIPNVKSRPVRHWMASQALAKMLSVLRGS